MTTRDDASRTFTPNPLNVIAEDLTGSVDATACFQTGETSVRISLNHAAPWSSPDMRTVQVYHSDSSQIPPEEAADRVRDAVIALKRWNERIYVYKKVDSTLRGNVGAEIEAALIGLGRSVAVLASALPEQQRTVRNGVLYVHGRSAVQRPVELPIESLKTSDEN